MRSEMAYASDTKWTDYWLMSFAKNGNHLMRRVFDIFGISSVVLCVPLSLLYFSFVWVFYHLVRAIVCRSFPSYTQYFLRTFRPVLVPTWCKPLYICIRYVVSLDHPGISTYLVWHYLPSTFCALVISFSIGISNAQFSLSVLWWHSDPRQSRHQKRRRKLRVRRGKNSVVNISVKKKFKNHLG